MFFQELLLDFQGNFCVQKKSSFSSIIHPVDLCEKGYLFGRSFSAIRPAKIFMNAKLQGTAKIFGGFAHLKCCLVNKKNVIAAKNLTFRQKERMMGDVGFWDNEDQKKKT